HREGVVHRNIKPSKIFLTAHGPKVLGFWVALMIEGELHAAGLKPMIGRQDYLSPEILRGGHVDYRTDLYSLGLVMYEMATGRRAYLGNFMEVAHAILHQVPISPRQLRPELPVELERIILKLLGKDPNERFQSATSLREDLRSIQTGT